MLYKALSNTNFCAIFLLTFILQPSLMLNRNDIITSYSAKYISTFDFILLTTWSIVDTPSK